MRGEALGVRAALAIAIGLGAVLGVEPSGAATPTREDAAAMIRQSESVLAPVYGPLAEQIVSDYGLSERHGTGIDLGSGPG